MNTDVCESHIHVCGSNFPKYTDQIIYPEKTLFIKIAKISEIAYN